MSQWCILVYFQPLLWECQSRLVSFVSRTSYIISWIFSLSSLFSIHSKTIYWVLNFLNYSSNFLIFFLLLLSYSLFAFGELSLTISSNTATEFLFHFIFFISRNSFLLCLFFFSSHPMDTVPSPMPLKISKIVYFRFLLLIHRVCFLHRSFYLPAGLFHSLPWWMFSCLATLDCPSYLKMRP